MMNLLAATIHLDILFAVHQYARFSTSPGKEYEEAVKRIARHLKIIKDKGMIFQADVSKSFETCVDAEFSSSHNFEWSDDYQLVLIRTACVIKSSNCPIVHVSKI